MNRRAGPRSSVPPPSLRSSSASTDAKKKPTKKKKHHTAPKPTPKPTPRPTPTSTPRPKTLIEVLTTGISPISASVSGGTTLTWKPVPGAVTYVVTAASSGTLSWSWSGSGTHVIYGDTTIDGAAGTAADGWPIVSPGTLSWSVLALDGHGAMLGAAFRVQ